METNKPDTTKEEIRALAEFLVHRLISEAVNMPEAAEHPDLRDAMKWWLSKNKEN